MLLGERHEPLVRALGGQADELELLARAGDDVEGLQADGTGRAEDQQAFHPPGHDGTGPSDPAKSPERAKTPAATVCSAAIPIHASDGSPCSSAGPAASRPTNPAPRMTELAAVIASARIRCGTRWSVSALIGGTRRRWASPDAPGAPAATSGERGAATAHSGSACHVHASAPSRAGSPSA